MLVYFMDTCSILWSFVMYMLWTFDILRGNLVYFSRFGILYQEKSGNPAGHPARANELPDTQEGSLKSRAAAAWRRADSAGSGRLAERGRWEWGWAE
jgi:hypothetical protein